MRREAELAVRGRPWRRDWWRRAWRWRQGFGSLQLVRSKRACKADGSWIGRDAQSKKWSVVWLLRKLQMTWGK